MGRRASKPPARKRLTIDISEAHHLNPRLLAAFGVGRRAAAAAASKAAAGRGGPAPAYAPLPSLAPLRRAHSGSELMGLTADAAASGRDRKDDQQSGGGGSGSSTPMWRRGKKRSEPASVLAVSTDAASLAAALTGGVPLAPGFDRRALTALGPRKWLKVDEDGEASIVEVAGPALFGALGVQPRDLRLLDWKHAAMYPSALLCRDAALLAAMEHIKCIITRDAVLVMATDQPAVLGFLAELQRRLKATTAHSAEDDLKAALLGSYGGGLANVREEMPFELQALEIVLDVVCEQLRRLTTDLEAAAQPCIRTSTAGKVSSLFLDRLRTLKARMVRLKTKVETIKEVMQKYLGADDDLYDLNLTAKERERSRRQASFLLRRPAPAPQRAPGMGLRLPARALGRMDVSPFAAFSGGPGTAAGSDDGAAALAAERAAAEAEAAAEQKAAGVAEAERVLEPYYLATDDLWNRLQTVNELFTDTEDFIDLELDSYRNHNLRMRVALNASLLMAGTMFSIANVWGMNLWDGPTRLHEWPSWTFLVGSTSISLIPPLLLVLFCVYLHRRGLGPTNITR
ncbi:hypothetical protein WJX81_000865 [Elliptochloris bilobata]|uniref:Magnesium transporter n=1 Tax=Elliptochloris bilobata TaxID=381761 RepID=A0AAW1SC79_9CHLO